MVHAWPRRAGLPLFAAVPAVVALWALAGTPSTATAGPPAARAEEDAPKARRIKLYAGKYNSLSQIAPPLQARRVLRGEASVDNIFDVTFTGFEDQPEAKEVFDTAFKIWSTLLETDVKIKVQANWTSLDAGVLGSAGPTTFRRNFANAPQTNTWYPIALANKLAGVDLATSEDDIDCSFNKDFGNWYFGTDGQTPNDEYDLLSVVLHELGHGLGFIGSMDVTGGTGSWGLGTAFPIIFDRFALNSAGTPLLNATAFPNPSGQLAAVLQGGQVFFSGSTAASANGGTSVRLYAPNPWDGGSSFSHFDEATFPAGNANSLMTPQIGQSEAIHSPGSLGLGLLKDIGW